MKLPTILITFCLMLSLIGCIYFELKEDEERCFYDDFYYQNVNKLYNLNIL